MWLTHRQPRFWPQLLTLALFLHTYPELIIQITCNFLQWTSCFISLGNCDMMFQITHKAIFPEKPFPALCRQVKSFFFVRNVFILHVCLHYKTKKSETALGVTLVMSLYFHMPLFIYNMEMTAPTLRAI